jgi:hypothetical protein
LGTRVWKECYVYKSGGREARLRGEIILVRDKLNGPINNNIFGDRVIYIYIILHLVSTVTYGLCLSVVADDNYICQ